MRRAAILVVGAAVVLSGCELRRPAPPPAKVPANLKEARAGFTTTLVRQESDTEPPPLPPSNLFSLVSYAVGEDEENHAYLSRHPADGKKRPAIIWISGGDCNSIGAHAWEAAPLENDQSARSFRQEGVVMMFPSLRGACGNTGVKEGFFGEVDDVLAAADFLAQQANVDARRIYLGGHSTGGTLVLLVAECDARFRAVFSFGPVEDVSGYGEEFQPFRMDPKEVELRSPGMWLGSIQSRVFVFEGAEPPGNVRALRSMSRASKNERVRFFAVKDADHFSVLARATRLAAKKILRDTGERETNIEFTDEEMDKLMR